MIYLSNILNILAILSAVALKIDRTIECERIDHSSVVNFIHSYIKQSSFNLTYSVIKFFWGRSYEKPSFYIVALAIFALILMILSFFDVFFRTVFLLYHMIYALYLKRYYRLYGSFLYVLSKGIERSGGKCIHIRSGFLILNMRQALSSIMSMKESAVHKGVEHAKVAFAKADKKVVIGATYTSSKKVEIGGALFKTEEMYFRKGLVFGNMGFISSKKQNALFDISQKPEELVVLEKESDALTDITKVTAMKHFTKVVANSGDFVTEHYNISSEVVQEITRIDSKLDKGFRCAIWGLYNSFYTDITEETMLEFDKILIYEIGQLDLKKDDSYEMVVQKLGKAYDKALNTIDGK